MSTTPAFTSLCLLLVRSATDQCSDVKMTMPTTRTEDADNQPIFEDASTNAVVVDDGGGGPQIQLLMMKMLVVACNGGCGRFAVVMKVAYDSDGAADRW
ncbi:hypothetical protein Dimus_039609 [Dionaea muscipula]